MDEHTIRRGNRTVGIFGPRSASLLLVWLASHRNRLHAFLVGGHRLSIVILWDSKGGLPVARTDGDLRAMKIVALGEDNA